MHQGVSVVDKVVGYVRVSTNKQEVGPEVQVAELERAAEREGWDLTIVREDGISAATLSKRPVILSVLDDMAAGKYSTLAVSKLDRLSRSTEDGARLLATAQRQGWRIVCLDLGVDTGTVMGSAMFNMALNFAEVERRFISQRTKAALAEVRKHKHVGRRRVLPRETVERVVDLRSRGLYLKQIASILNAEQVRTASGTPWTIAKVQGVLNTLTAKGEYLGDLEQATG